MFSDVIKLITVTESTNDIGDSIKCMIVSEEKFANKKSIRQSEFYQAASVGLRPEMTFEMRICEYNQEPMLEYNSKTYKIIRTYEKDSELIELICQGVVNGVI